MKSEAVLEVRRRRSLPALPRRPRPLHALALARHARAAGALLGADNVHVRRQRRPVRRRPVLRCALRPNSPAALTRAVAPSCRRRVGHPPPDDPSHSRAHSARPARAVGRRRQAGQAASGAAGVRRPHGGGARRQGRQDEEGREQVRRQVPDRHLCAVCALLRPRRRVQVRSCSCARPLRPPPTGHAAGPTTRALSTRHAGASRPGPLLRRKRNRPLLARSRLTAARCRPTRVRAVRACVLLRSQDPPAGHRARPRRAASPRDVEGPALPRQGDYTPLTILPPIRFPTPCSRCSYPPRPSSSRTASSLASTRSSLRRRQTTRRCCSARGRAALGGHTPIARSPYATDRAVGLDAPRPAGPRSYRASASRVWDLINTCYHENLEPTWHVRSPCRAVRTVKYRKRAQP